MHSINLRVNDELKAAIDRVAEKRGLPVATYIKSRLTELLREEGELKPKKK